MFLVVCAFDATVANDAPLPSQRSLVRHHRHLGLSLLQCKAWRLSTVNADYSVCATYPPAVMVPKSVDDDTLRTAARFRQGGRFPVLCYYHQKNGMVRRSAALSGVVYGQYSLKIRLFQLDR